MFRTVLLAAAVSLASTVAASAAWVTTDLHLRAGPGTGYHSRTTLRACSQVDVQGQRSGWLRVSTRSGEGWVSARYVSNNQPRHCQSYRPPVIHRPGPDAFFPLPIPRDFFDPYPRRRGFHPPPHWRDHDRDRRRPRAHDWRRDDRDPGREDGGRHWRRGTWHEDGP